MNGQRKYFGTKQDRWTTMLFSMIKRTRYSPLRMMPQQEKSHHTQNRLVNVGGTTEKGPGFHRTVS